MINGSNGKQHNDGDKNSYNNSNYKKDNENEDDDGNENINYLQVLIQINKAFYGFSSGLNSCLCGWDANVVYVGGCNKSQCQLWENL